MNQATQKFQTLDSVCLGNNLNFFHTFLACDISKKLPQAAVGTHGYMAPEVLTRGVTYQYPADWFSLGCMLYKLLKGHRFQFRQIKSDSKIILSPFRAHKTKDKREIDRRTLEHHPDLPEEFSPGLRNLLNGLLEKDPTKRLGRNGPKDIMVILSLKKSCEKYHIRDMSGSQKLIGAV